MLLKKLQAQRVSRVTVAITLAQHLHSSLSLFLSSRPLLALQPQAHQQWYLVLVGGQHLRLVCHGDLNQSIP